MINDTLQIRNFHSRLLELNDGKWFSFEPHLAALYRTVLQPGSVAVDGGANVGLHTLQMAQAVLPDGLVVAIEPVPELLEKLDAKRRELPNDLIRLLPCGLSSAVGEADFYQVLDPRQQELSGLCNRHYLQNQQVKKIRIGLTTLDAVCAGFDRLDFLKLDLEGAEMDALRGGRLTLTKFRPVVAFEQDQYSPQYFRYTWDDLLEYFASFGYEIYDLFGLHYTQAAMLNQCAVWDFVGVPSEHPDKDGLFRAVSHSMEVAGLVPPVAPLATGISQNLKPRNLASSCALDYIGSVCHPAAQKSVHVSRGKHIRFSGWAIDKPNKTAAGGVDIVIDKVPYSAVYGRQRPDVATHFRNAAYQDSGFELIFPSEMLPKGKRVGSVRVISYDKRSYYQGPTVKFTID